jgi:hypothetical protein
MRRAVLPRIAGLLVLFMVWPLALPAISDPSQGLQRITSLQQISRDHLPSSPDAQRDTEVGPSAAVDPNNPLRVVSVFQQSKFGGVGTLDNGYATSQDGGQTWATAPLGLTRPTGGAWQRAGDPVVTFGPDGAAYASSLVFDRLLCPSAVVVQRSPNGGLTWKNPVVVHRDDDCSVFNDKDWIASDTNETSPFVGRVYVVWMRSEAGQSIVLSSSDDAGATWKPPVTVSPSDLIAVSPVAVVQPDGHLTIVYSDWISDTIVAQTSVDGGETFSLPVTIATYKGVDPSDMWTGALNNRSSVSVDPLTGIIYASWQDTRFRSDGLNDVVLTRSTDGGSTWSGLQRVNLDPPDSLIDHLTPAVASHGGSVHVTFTYRDMADGLNQEVHQHYIVSGDGGETFGDETQLGKPSDLTWASRFTSDYLALRGEYMGIAANGSLVYVVWPRSSQPRQIVRVYHQTMWSATIEL